MEESERGVKTKKESQEEDAKKRGNSQFTYRSKKEKNQKDDEIYSKVYQKICERLSNVEPIIYSSELDSSL